MPINTDPYVAHSIRGGNGYWGTGQTVEEAKRRCKEKGGNLNNVTVYRLPDGATNPMVDVWGIHWVWADPEAMAAAEESGMTEAVEVYHRGPKRKK